MYPPPKSFIFVINPVGLLLGLPSFVLNLFSKTSIHGVQDLATHTFSPLSALSFIEKLVPYIHIHDLHLTIINVFNSNDPHTQILYLHLSLMALDVVNNTRTKFNDDS